MNIHFSFERAQKERRFLPHFSCTLRDSNEREIALESKKLRLQKGLIYPNSKLPAHRYTILYEKNQEKCKICCTPVPYNTLQSFLAAHRGTPKEILKDSVDIAGTPLAQYFQTVVFLPVPADNFPVPIGRKNKDSN